VIRPFNNPLKEEAGFIVMTGNLFDSAIMKTSVIGSKFRQRYLEKPGKENVFEGAAVVFEGPEDYHARINDPSLHIEEHSILFMRNCGPVGYPGSAEVVNMLPPDALIKSGILELPCVGDGRQSGTSASPSILNASPEAAAGGNLALLRTGDPVRIDLNARRVDVLIDADEMDERRKAPAPCVKPLSQTPWQEMYRAMVGQLATGACLEPATLYLNIIETRGNPRHSH
jgi:dihydroxy-acid dehydratase